MRDEIHQQVEHEIRRFPTDLRRCASLHQLSRFLQDLRVPRYCVIEEPGGVARIAPTAARGDHVLQPRHRERPAAEARRGPTIADGPLRHDVEQQRRAIASYLHPYEALCGA